MGQEESRPAYEQNSSVIRELSVGDLIEVKLDQGLDFDFQGSSHWGVYVGGQNVIHLVGIPNGLDFSSTLGLFSISGKTFRRAEVRKDQFWNFLGSQANRAQINNGAGRMPLPAAAIVRNAQSSLGHMTYSPKTQSCELFAKWCRYGDDYYKDQENLRKGAALVAGVAGLAVGAYAAYKIFSGDKNEAASSDSSVEDLPCGSSATARIQDGTRATSNSSRNKEEDRYYGRFRCNKCHSSWDSANVYTWSGTKKVKYGQKCKSCNSDWIYPYELQMLECSVCHDSPCICRCENCGKLRNKPYVENMPAFGYGSSDDHYCSCGKKKPKPIGDHIDPKRPHPSKFCGRCQSGRYCTSHPRGL